MNKLLYSSRALVWAFSLITLTLILIRSAIIIADFYGIIDFVNINIIKYEPKIKVFSWFFLAISSAYVGFDKVLNLKNTTELPKGQLNLGNLKKIRHLIFMSFILMFFSIVCEALTGLDFDSEAFISAFGTNIILSVSGNKAIKMSRYISPTNTEEQGISEQEEEEKEVSGFILKK